MKTDHRSEIYKEETLKHKTYWGVHLQEIDPRLCVVMHPEAKCFICRIPQLPFEMYE